MKRFLPVLILSLILFLAFGCFLEGPVGPTGPTGPRHNYTSLGFFIYDTTYAPQANDTIYLNFEINQYWYAGSMGAEIMSGSIPYDLMIKYSNTNQSNTFYSLGTNCILKKSPIAGDLKNVATSPGDEYITTTGSFGLGEVYFLTNANGYQPKNR